MGVFTLGEIKTAKRLMCVYGDNAKIVLCTQSLILVCENGNSVPLSTAMFPTVYHMGIQVRIGDIR